MVWKEYIRSVNSVQVILKSYIIYSVVGLNQLTTLVLKQVLIVQHSLVLNSI